MFAASLAQWMNRRGLHYGWVIVFITFCTLLTTAGAMGLPGALIKPLGSEYGWTVEDISRALAIRLVLFGLIAPFSAAIMDRYGVRNTILVAVCLIGGALLAARHMTQYWQLVVLWGIIVGVGTGLTALVLGALVSGRWFTKNRGLVVGFLTASSATGQLAFLPLAAWLVDNYGWRMALVPSLFGLGLVAILVIAFMRDRPADVGLPPYGETQILPAPPPIANAFTRALTVLAEAARLPVFWALAGTFFICGLSTNGLIQQHFIPFCGDYGMAAVDAGIVLAMMGGFDFIGTIASGWLSDRVDNRYLLAWYYGLRGLALLYIPYAHFSITGLTIFAAFYGLDWVATVPPTVKLAAASFGREKASIVFGWVFAAHQMGAATAAYGAGLSRTELSTYVPAFFVAGALCLLATGVCLMISPKSKLQAPGNKVAGVTA
ncbi:MAG: MFS transporter [Hyphomicrobiales bacterium]|nr:MFS transporter [Hyphomicrobiales bacterium]MDE2115553.1 MFS transporter [Hyphomicrobiales bacterium]